MTSVATVLRTACHATASVPPTLVLPADEWRALERCARYHEVEPLLWNRLSSCGLPADLALAWRERWYLAGLRYEARVAVLQPLLHAWHAAAVPIALLKGMALAARVYQFPAQRCMADIDVLVPPDHVGRAVAVLHQQGWQSMPSQQRASYRYSGERRFVHSATRCRLELHWYLCGGVWAHAVGAHQHTGWQRAQSGTLGVAPLWCLHPHDLLINVVHHLAVSNQFGTGLGRMLVDVDRLVRHGGFDWPLLADEVRQIGLATVFWCVFDHAHALLDTPVAAPIAALAPSRPRQRALHWLIDPAGWCGRDLRRISGLRLVLLWSLIDRTRPTAMLLRTVV